MISLIVPDFTKTESEDNGMSIREEIREENKKNFSFKKCLVADIT